MRMAAMMILLLLTACASTAGSATKKPEIAVLETNKGTIEIELDREHAPKTVDNFVQYVNDGFYDGLLFHRVIPQFMIQGGGYENAETKRPTRSPIELESNNGLKNLAGTVAMARTAFAHSATSQFFINTIDNPRLDYAEDNPGYAVFGKVVAGMDVVKTIEMTQTADNGLYTDWPVEDIVIERAYMK